MGVPGLWEILRPASHCRSLTHLSVVDGFEVNNNGLRGYRVGIDASIWFFHSEWSREGENPQLRNLLFRLIKLLNSPFLPLFVFDGPGRPSEKRGKKINRSKPHGLVDGLKRLIVAFGFEWRTAPGEAEAELAYLNRAGVIDAIISDDVDNFLFGASVVIRNSSATLTGNKHHANTNANGKQDDLHTTIYRATDIAAHPSIQLTQGGLILIGLLSGGDYQIAGLKGCGLNTAHALARCGLGDSLLDAALALSEDDLVHEFLPFWRDQLRAELRTDSRGFIGKKCPTLAKNVPEDFPNVQVLLCYANPLTSKTAARGRNKDEITWDCDPCPAQITSACEQFFEWGYEEKLIYRFRTILWPGLVCRILRRAALNTDRRVLLTTSGENGGSICGDQASMLLPSRIGAATLRRPHSIHTVEGDRTHSDEPLIRDIHSEREHASTDGLLEYRLEIAPAQLVRLSRAGIAGSRSKPEFDSEYAGEDGEVPVDKAALSDPHENLRIWMPASMVRLGEPCLVEQWEGVQRKRLEKTSAKGKGKARAHNGATVVDSGDDLPRVRSGIHERDQVSPETGRNFSTTVKHKVSVEHTLPSKTAPDPAISKPVAKAKGGTPANLKSSFKVTKPRNSAKPGVKKGAVKDTEILQLPPMHVEQAAGSQRSRSCLEQLLVISPESVQAKREPGPRRRQPTRMRPDPSSDSDDSASHSHPFPAKRSLKTTVSKATTSSNARHSQSPSKSNGPSLPRPQRESSSSRREPDNEPRIPVGRQVMMSQPMVGTDVIEITSDSDPPAPPSPQARIKGKVKPAKTCSPSGNRKRLKSSDEDVRAQDIIDLT